MGISSQLFQELVNEINDALFVVDPSSGRIIYANETASRNLGYTSNELRHMSVLDFQEVLPDQKAWDEAAKIFRKQDHATISGRHKRKDGSTFPVEVVVRQVSLENIRYFVAVARDITLRNEQEKDLNDCTHGLAILSKISRTLAESLNADHVLQAAVNGAVELAGLDTAAIYLRDGENLLLQATTPPLPENFPDELRIAPLHDHLHIKKAITSCGPVLVHDLSNEFMTPAERLAVEERNLRTVLFVPLLHGAKSIGAFIVGSHDEPVNISDSVIELSFTLGNLTALTLKNALLYKEVHEYADKLESSLEERIKAENEQERLHNQLLQAQKMESVGRLAGGVAHDFNNMLSVIAGYSEMLLEKVSADHPFHNDLLQIKEAAERSTNLTRQLLAFARKQTVQPKVFELNKVIENMIKMLKRLIGEDIDLTWIPGEELGLVKIDPSQVDQILANLCVNARDSISGSGKVTIETKKASFNEEYCLDHPGYIPGRYVMLAVSDTGTGMDEEVVRNIFDPYFSTKKKGEGTGLGLSTVYGIVKQNKGFINIYSAPGQGTTFRIYLSRYDEGDTKHMPERASMVAERGNETLLLVEDEAMILDLARRLLVSLGYKVLTANRPKEALKVASDYDGRIDLLITDVVMPEMNGRELAAHLAGAYPDLKTMYMSGYTANVIAHHGVLDEGITFLEKPFSLTELASKVREAISG